MAYNHYIVLEEIATKVLDHSEENKRFFKASGLSEIEELISQLSSVQDYGMIASDDDDFSKESGQTRAIFKKNEYSFVIFKKFEDGNMEDLFQVKDWCKNTANTISDIIDHYCRKHAHGIRPLSINKFKFYSLGNMYGFWAMQCVFFVTEPYEYEINPNYL